MDRNVNRFPHTAPLFPLNKTKTGRRYRWRNYLLPVKAGWQAQTQRDLRLSIATTSVMSAARYLEESVKSISLKNSGKDLWLFNLKNCLKSRFLISNMNVQNKKYGNFVFISRSTAWWMRNIKYKKNFCSSSLWTCLYHKVIIIKKPK